MKPETTDTQPPETNQRTVKGQVKRLVRPLYDPNLEKDVKIAVDGIPEEQLDDAYKWTVEYLRQIRLKLAGNPQCCDCGGPLESIWTNEWKCPNHCRQVF